MGLTRPVLTFDPSEGLVQFCEMAVAVKVLPQRVGPFCEMGMFLVEGARMRLGCVVKGRVVLRTLEVREEVGDVGEWWMGFETHREVELHHWSEIAWTFGAWFEDGVVVQKEFEAVQKYNSLVLFDVGDVKEQSEYDIPSWRHVSL
jgi:hypothetical protein